MAEREFTGELKQEPTLTHSALQDRSRYLQALFYPGEGLCYGRSAKDNQVITLERALSEEIEFRPFVALNPLDMERDRNPTKSWHRPEVPRRSNANCTAFRNFLIEFDKGPLEGQARRLQKLKVPYTTLVYSGKKSLHAVISLTSCVGGLAQWQEVFEMLAAVIYGIDDSVDRPCSFTRAPFAVRPETGLEQELLDVRKRVSPERFYSWIARFYPLIEKAKEAKTQKEQARMAHLKKASELGLEGLESLPPWTIAVLNKERMIAQGKRHQRLCALTYEILDAGVPYESAMTLICGVADHCGVSSELGREDEAERIVNDIYGGQQ